MKTKLGVTAFLAACALTALVAGGCTNNTDTGCEGDKACTDKSASCCKDAKASGKTACCESMAKDAKAVPAAPAVTK